MKTTLKIAKAEINSLFYSPIAWVLGIIFLIQCGLSYVSTLSEYLTYQELGPQYYNILKEMTNHVFAPGSGLFPQVIGNLYLYIPLLTMGLIAREINNGTIKLLYSSPIKIKQIVVGKFVAMMFYNLILLSILSIFVVAAMFNIRSADIGMLLASLLGVYLLLCTYAAIGLFMSSLTSYQIVAALGTLVIFATLEYVGGLWQGIDFVRDLTYFLSISGRTDNMLFGLITTKDIIYFVLIILMFLGFTVVKLQAERESKAGFKVRIRYILIFCTALLVGYITSLPQLTGYYDASVRKQMTLVPNSEKIIKEFGDEPLEVTVYANLVDIFFANLATPDKRNEDMKRWEPYRRFKPDIKFNYVYYYDVPHPNQQLLKYNPGKTLKQVAENAAKSLGMKMQDFKTPEQIKKLIDLSPEHNRYIMQLKYKGRTTFLRVFDDMTIVPTETEIDAALKRLTSSKFPKICFLEGEFERSKSKLGDRDYGKISGDKAFRYALVNQGFDLSAVSLEHDQIPADIAVLVIADPKVKFSPVVLSKIQKYIDEGGNLLIAGEPGKQDILNPLISQMGVKIIDGVLVQKSTDFALDDIRPRFTSFSTIISNKLEDFIKDSLTLSMPGTAGLSYHQQGSYHINPITLTDERYSWNKKGKLTLDSADVVFSPGEGDEKRAIPTILALTRMVKNKEQHIIITGDADFISNAELSKSGVNFEFGSKLFGWFTNGQYPIDTRRPKSKDDWINLSDNGITTLKIFFLGIFPGLILAVGSVFLIRRKRK